MSLNRHKISSNMIETIADISKNYYQNNDPICTGCGFKPKFGLMMKNLDNCSRCNQSFAPKVSSNQINGNIDYLGEIVEAAVRKNLKSETKLAKHIDSTVVPYLNGVIGLSKYERIDMNEDIYTKIKGVDRVPFNKHYNTIDSLNLGKSIKVEEFEEAMQIYQKKINELKEGSDFGSCNEE